MPTPPRVGCSLTGPRSTRTGWRYAQCAAALAVLVLLPGCQQPATPLPGEALAPQEPPAPPAVPIYVSAETSGDVIVVDGERGTVFARIPVGKRPRGIRLTPDGKTLLVALSGSPIAGPGVDESTLPPADRSADGIGVVDLAAQRLLRVLPSGQDPEAFDISADGGTVYVSNEETGEMSAVDVAASTIRRVTVGGEPEGVTIRPDGRTVYVTCEAENEVVAVDTTTLAVVARIKTGARPRAVAFSLDGRTGFVTAENTGDVTVFDATTNKPVGSIAIPPVEGEPMAPRPMGVALAPDGRRLFVSLGRATSVAVIDVAARRVVQSLQGIGTRPWGIGVSPDGRQIFTANGPSGDVSVVDVESGAVVRRIDVGGSPWGIAVDPRP